MYKYLYPDKTCVLLYKGRIIYESRENNVRPLIRYLMENGIPQKGVILIDKVVGTAVSNLILYCKIKMVYAKVISKPALSLLIKHKVKIDYRELTENILRLDKTDICPLEKTIMGISDYDEAVKTLFKIVGEKILITPKK